MIRLALGLVPVWVWAAAAGIAALAVAGWHLDAVSDAKDAGRSEVQALWDRERAVNTKTALDATTKARADEQRMAAANLENVNEAERLAARTRRNDGAAAAAGAGLLERAREVATRCDRGREAPPAAGASAPAASAGDLLADVSGRLYEAGRQLALEADKRGATGSTCERDADSVRAPPVR